MSGRPLLRLILARPGPYAALIGLWILLRATILVTGLLLQRIFDGLSGAASPGLTVWTVLAVLAATEAFRVFVWYGLILAKVEPGYTYRLRAGLQHGVLRAVLGRPAATALGQSTGDAISRLGGDADEVGVFAIWSASNVSRLVVAGAALVVMVSIDPVVTAGLVVPVVAIMLAGRALNGRIGYYHTLSREAAGEVSAVVAESVASVQAIKVARAEHRFVERLRRIGVVRRRVAVRAETLASLQQSLFSATAALGTGAVLLLAAGRLRAGEFTVGDLALFTFYIQFLAEAVNALGMFLSRIRQAGVSFDRLAALTAEPSELLRPELDYLDRRPPPVPPAPVAGPFESLTASGLAYRYPSSPHSIGPMDLMITPGTLTVITGKVGAGKSTLLKALLGLLPGDGEVRWNGHVVGDRAAHFVPPRTAFVPQVPRLFSGTLRENVLLGYAADEDAVRRALHTAAFAPDLADMPDGLDTVIGPRGLRLSGGQAQRVAAARMLVREPQIVVFDDLSNGLDVDTEQSLWDRLLTENRTVLAVSTRPELLRRADQVVVLRDGVVAEIEQRNGGATGRMRSR